MSLFSNDLWIQCNSGQNSNKFFFLLLFFGTSQTNSKFYIETQETKNNQGIIEE